LNLNHPTNSSSIYRKSTYMSNAGKIDGMLPICALFYVQMATVTGPTEADNKTHFVLVPHKW
jgi:hypothetical protein